MRRRDFRDQRAEHDELATLSDRDQDRDSGQDGGSGERRVRERCEQDREQADREYRAGGEQGVSAAHPRHHPCRRYLRYDDKEGVDEDDDTDPDGPDRCMCLRKRREDEGEERAADHHKREVARDQGEQEPIPSNSSETPCALARRRSVREARIRDPGEHDQREDDERDCVEEVEGLERLEVMTGGRDDEARNRRAEAETTLADFRKQAVRDMAGEGVGGTIVARNADTLAATAKEIAASTGVTVVPVAADVTTIVRRWHVPAGCPRSRLG